MRAENRSVLALRRWLLCVTLTAIPRGLLRSCNWYKGTLCLHLIAIITRVSVIARFAMRIIWLRVVFIVYSFLEPVCCTSFHLTHAWVQKLRCPLYRRIGYWTCYSCAARSVVANWTHQVFSSTASDPAIWRHLANRKGVTLNLNVLCASGHCLPVIATRGHRLMTSPTVVLVWM